ncbi:hypothetical protein [Glutamicibacter sp. X7]
MKQVFMSHKAVTLGYVVVFCLAMSLASQAEFPSQPGVILVGLTFLALAGRIAVLALRYTRARAR